VILRDGTEVEDRRLDRLVHYDERSLAFPISAVVPEQPVSKTWGIPGAILDQGVEGACVGFGVTHELAAYPAAATGLDGRFARERIYWEAQHNDPWPGGSYPDASPRYEGTAVIEGVKAAQRLGYYEEYRWAFSVDDVIRAVGHEGPVVVGSKWWTGMDNPSSSGLVAPTGTPRGGHCYLIRGVLLKPRWTEGPVLRIRNSWGIDWGVRGDCFIKAADFAKLLADGGEAVVPMRRHKL
jgi:hypothetical protein